MLPRSALLATTAGLIAASAGCGGSSESGTTVTETAAAKPSQPATFLKTTAPAKADTTTTARSYVIRGRSTPGAIVEIDGETVEADERGRFSKRVKLSLGENEIVVDAEANDREPAETQYLGFTVRQTAAQRAAAKARRQQAAAAREAARERKLQADVAEALNGSSRKMSRAVAREVLALCSAGQVADVDVCFEAGYKTGSDVAEKYAP